MERGKRKEVGLYEDWCDTPVPHLKNYEIEDIIGFEILDAKTHKVIAHWKNPDYKKD